MAQLWKENEKKYKDIKNILSNKTFTQIAYDTTREPTPPRAFEEQEEEAEERGGGSSAMTFAELRQCAN